MLRIDWSTCVSDSGATLTDLSALGIVSILVAVGNQNPAAAPLFSRDPRALFWSLPFNRSTGIPLFCVVK
ncbi:MAG: hypothetical protein QOH96_2764 [Blastocatellia bacterium]|jgi:hypothetical protein|nr:hypothetical protein [Blastocatellia bacterium]